MKKYKYLAFFALSVLIVACEKEKKNVTIDSSKLKQTYALNDDVVLQLDSKSASVSKSFQYFVTDRKIGPVKENNAVTYNLSKLKYGVQNIKAIAFENGTPYEALIEIDVLSHVRPAVYSYTVVNTYPHDIKAY